MGTNSQENKTVCFAITFEMDTLNETNDTLNYTENTHT